uniref:G2/mitotic-specific cyclin-B3 n=1 Tax=Cacopsylla melanoneura TaxID=428564 RepID=A0A8D8ZHY4_9HEMI
MAPSLVLPNGVATRSRTSLGGLSLRSSNFSTNAKRKQENSPPKGNKATLKRRPALGELTNAAALKTAALKKGSNLDLSNLKPVSRTAINLHHDIVKPKTKVALTTRTLTVTKASAVPTKQTVTLKTAVPKPKAPAVPNLAPKANKLPLLVTKPITKQASLTQTRKVIQSKSNTSTKPGRVSNCNIKTSSNATDTKPEFEQPAINIRRESLRSHRRSSGVKSDESSLYVSALDDLNLTNSNNKKSNSQQGVASRKTSCSKTSSSKQRSVSEKKEKSLIEHFDKEIQLDDKLPVKAEDGPPPGVGDFDKETWDDPLQVSCYALHIFEYLKSRELHFKIRDYLPFQSSSEKGRISAEMRSVLVDWMVEVQETFELNHETLYLAVKLVDLFLSKELCSRENLQLLGATAIFVSSKFDDRIPPQLSDLEYICSHTYSVQDLKDMEIKLICTVGFDLGIPLSYRFLRRYARCNKIQLPLLTLARYILELSLMEYSLSRESDSKLASASLYLAQRMSKIEPWNSTLEYYSGYKVSCFKQLVIELNRLLLCQPRTVMMQTLSTVYNKYSHPIFYEVAKTPLIKEADLFS